MSGKWVPETEMRSELAKTNRMVLAWDGVVRWAVWWSEEYGEWYDGLGEATLVTHVWTGALPEPPSEDAAEESADV